MAKRKTFIDVAKGIGIILVIFGHLGIDGQINQEVIYAFHMPFFFLLSGVFANTKIDFKTYFKKAFTSLYLPFLIFFAVDTLLFAVINFIQGDNLIYFIKSRLIAFTGFKFEIPNGPIWFLFALFIIKLVHYFADKNKIVKYSLAVLCVAFVFVSAADLFTLPYRCIDVIAIPGLFFYIVGSEAKELILNFDNIVDCKKLIFAITFVASLIILIFAARKNGNVDMVYHTFGNPFLYFINSFIGIFAFLILSVFLDKISFTRKVFTFYGVNSIIVLVSHMYIARRVIPILMNHIGLGEYTYNRIALLVFLTVISLIMIPVILIANKYFYFVFGKKKPTLVKKT